MNTDNNQAITVSDLDNIFFSEISTEIPEYFLLRQRTAYEQTYIPVSRPSMGRTSITVELAEHIKRDNKGA